MSRRHVRGHASPVTIDVSRRRRNTEQNYRTDSYDVIGHVEDLCDRRGETPPGGLAPGDGGGHVTVVTRIRGLQTRTPFREYGDHTLDGANISRVSIASGVVVRQTPSRGTN